MDFLLGVVGVVVAAGCWIWAGILAASNITWGGLDSHGDPNPCFSAGHWFLAVVLFLVGLAGAVLALLGFISAARK